MVELGQGYRLASEATAGFLVGERTSWQDLDGDLALQSGVLPSVDDTHSAPAQLLHDGIAAEVMPDQSLGEKLLLDRSALADVRLASL